MIWKLINLCKKRIFRCTIKSKRKNLFHLSFVANVKISLLKRKLLTNILRACIVFFFRFTLKRLKNIMCFVLPCALIWEKILILLLISILRRLAELYIWLVAEILELSFLKSQKFLRKLSTVCFTTQNLGKLLIIFIIWITTRYQRYFFFLFFKGSQWNYLLFAKFRK